MHPLLPLLGVWGHWERAFTARVEPQAGERAGDIDHAQTDCNASALVLARHMKIVEVGLRHLQQR